MKFSEYAHERCGKHFGEFLYTTGANSLNEKKSIFKNIYYID